MGEYAIRKSDRQKIKIGTCSNMYYLRWEDRAKVIHIPGNLDAQDTECLFWRLPYPDEDHLRPGDYTDAFRGVRLYKKVGDYYRDLEIPAMEPGTIQLRHDSGLLVNVPCYHGAKLPEAEGIRFFWNGKSHHYELCFIKNINDKLYPVIKCQHCGEMWTCAWADIWDYLPTEFQSRFEQYRND